MDPLYKINEIDKDYDDNWMIDLDKYYMNIIRGYLSNDGISSDNIRTIVKNAARVLGYCPNPTENNRKDKTGIVIGKVQSGKTSNFIAISALSFDNGYDINIVLGGTKENLLEQNTNRIKECYENAGDNVIILNTKDNINLLTESEITNFIERGKKVVILTLKHAKHINKLTEQLLKKEGISNLPILIIDDEGDEYSLNTKAKKNGESSTYAAIKNMKNACAKHCYISVTATPQANLIISTIDQLSPDFGVLVSPGDGYCGLEVFHDVGSPYCVQLPNDEGSLLDDNNVPESFYIALATFYVGAGISRIRHGSREKFSMLINPSVKINDLTQVYNKVNLIIDSWKDLAKNPKDIAFRNLVNHLRKGFEVYSTTVTDCDFDEILNSVLETFKSTKLHLIHGKNPLKDADKYYEYNIYLGGQMMGRGITLKGLAVTYIIRESKSAANVDTVQQRARWFGYRKDIDLCRVFAPDKIIKQYSDIKVHEDDLWQTIIDNDAEGVKFKKMKRIFAIGKDLRLTRTSVAKTKSYAFSNWNIEDRFLFDTKKIKNNLQFINAFKDKYKDKLVSEKYGSGNGSPNVFLRDIPLKDFLDEVYSKCYFPDNAKVPYSYINKVYRYLDGKKVNPIADIVWMRDEVGKYSEHEIDSDGKIANYMVGRRPRVVQPGEEPIYKGDREIHRGNVIEIQIHYIKDTNTGIASPTFAIYLPKDYVDKIVVVEPEE